MKRLPFDWKTPFGYFIAVVPQAIDVFCVVFNVPPIIGFMYGSCSLIIAFIEDITSEFKALAINERMKPNFMKMKKRFCNIIQLYTDVKL